MSLPPTAISPLEHAQNVLRATIPQVAFLAVYLLVVLVNLEDDDSLSGFLAVQWLAIPVSLVICLRTTERASPPAIDHV